MSSEEYDLPVVAYDLSHLDNPPEETLVHAEDAVLFQKEKGRKLTLKSDAERKIASLKADKKALEQNLEEEKRSKKKARRDGRREGRNEGRLAERQELLERLEPCIEKIKDEIVDDTVVLKEQDWSDVDHRLAEVISELEELKSGLQQGDEL